MGETVEHPLALPPPVPVTLEEMRAATVGEPGRIEGGRVEVADADPAWPDHFAEEAVRIRHVLGGRVLRLDHVGSTSVPGLPAKPIIDINLVVADSADEDAWLPDLEAAGYRLTIREPDWYRHRLLKGPGRDINLHVFSAQPDGEWRRNLLFRDWLRADDADRRAYGALKQRLANERFDRAFEYNNAKAEAIHAIYARALAADAAAGYPSLSR